MDGTLAQLLTELYTKVAMLDQAQQRITELEAEAEKGATRTATAPAAPGPTDQVES